MAQFVKETTWETSKQETQKRVPFSPETSALRWSPARSVVVSFPVGGLFPKDVRRSLFFPIRSATSFPQTSGGCRYPLLHCQFTLPEQSKKFGRNFAGT
jgi:hypothetical protein